jgi:uncharacterized membrane protein
LVVTAAALERQTQARLDMVVALFLEAVALVFTLVFLLALLDEPTAVGVVVVTVMVVLLLTVALVRLVLLFLNGKREI